MRIFSYILSALVTVFVINIALSFSLPSYRNALVDARTALFGTTRNVAEVPLADDKDTGNARLAESLERLDKHIESLAAPKISGTGTLVSSGTVGTGTLGTGASVSVEESAPKELVIPVSGLFLSKIMPEVMLKKTENKGFFGIQVMDKLPYSTYLDEKTRVRVYAFQDTYDNVLLNLKLASKVYAINETDQFFGFTFFLNPVKKDPKDTLVRFVTAVEGRAIGVEVPANYYSTLKKMLLKNK